MKAIYLMVLLFCTSTCCSQINSVEVKGGLIDSLHSNNENKVIVFKTNCTGCIVTDKPCENYVENGNPWNLYIIWNNAGGSYIKKFNNCGSSEIVSIRKWKDDPFDIINSNASEIDTTQLKYPLSLNLEDSTWYETGINHYNYFELSFPSYDIKDKLIKDYAFHETKSDEQFFVGNKDEYNRNEKRYAFNNSTSIKKILDSLLLITEKKEKKLRIIE